jgi:hypothetical protein
MRENVNIVLYVVRHNLLLLSGLGLVAVFLLLLAHIKSKLKDSGYGTASFFFHPGDWELPADYRAVQSKHGWSPWPEYLIWPCLVAGVVSLLVGLFR